jgi:hypothetical protein
VRARIVSAYDPMLRRVPDTFRRRCPSRAYIGVAVIP